MKKKIYFLVALIVVVGVTSGIFYYLNKSYKKVGYVTKIEITDNGSCNLYIKDEKINIANNYKFNDNVKRKTKGKELQNLDSYTFNVDAYNTRLLVDKNGLGDYVYTATDGNPAEVIIPNKVTLELTDKYFEIKASDKYMDVKTFYMDINGFSLSTTKDEECYNEIKLNTKYDVTSSDEYKTLHRNKKHIEEFIGDFSKSMDLTDLK